MDGLDGLRSMPCLEADESPLSDMSFAKLARPSTHCFQERQGGRICFVI